MALIAFSGKQLQTGSLYRCIPEGSAMPERPLKTPRSISKKDSELENLLRAAVGLRKAQKRTARTQTGRSKGNRKAK